MRRAAYQFLYGNDKTDKYQSDLGHKIDFNVSQLQHDRLLKLELEYSSQDWLPMRNEAGMSLAAVQLEKPQALSFSVQLWSPNTLICCSSPIWEFWNWQCSL